MNLNEQDMATGHPAYEETDFADAEIALGVLDAVERNPSVTQRSVAQELGIALGLANAYLKRCVRKGLIKVSCWATATLPISPCSSLAKRTSMSQALPPPKAPPNFSVNSRPSAKSMPS